MPIFKLVFRIYYNQKGKYATSKGLIFAFLPKIFFVSKKADVIYDQPIITTYNENNFVLFFLNNAIFHVRPFTIKASIYLLDFYFNAASLPSPAGARKNCVLDPVLCDHSDLLLLGIIGWFGEKFSFSFV